MSGDRDFSHSQRIINRVKLTKNNIRKLESIYSEIEAGRVSYDMKFFREDGVHTEIVIDREPNILYSFHLG